MVIRTRFTGDNCAFAQTLLRSPMAVKAAETAVAALSHSQREQGQRHIIRDSHIEPA